MATKQHDAALKNGGPTARPFDYHSEARLRIYEAGHNLRVLLMQDPRSLDRLDDLDLLVLVRSQGKGFINLTAQKADKLDRQKRESARAKRDPVRDQHVRFEMENYQAVPPKEEE